MFQKESISWSGRIAETEGGARFFRNTIVRMLLVFGTLPLLVSVLLLAYFIRSTDGTVVLHYNVYFGVDLIGTWWQAYFLPMFGLIFFIGNILLSRRLYATSERIAAYLSLFSSVLMNASIGVAVFFVCFINY